MNEYAEDEMFDPVDEEMIDDLDGLMIDGRQISRSNSRLLSDEYDEE